jgi:hypothetical protein
MKSLAVVLLIALAALGVASVAVAQSGSNPTGTPAPPPTAAPPSDSTRGSGAVSTPGGDLKGRIDVDSKSDSKPAAGSDARSDDGSALPRAAVGERTTIFGLSPTAAVVIAAALLVVVILAIVAMTRSNDTYIER